jgi:hypothetical protein
LLILCLAGCVLGNHLLAHRTCEHEATDKAEEDTDDSE